MYLRVKANSMNSESHRQSKFAKLIQKELGDYFIREGKTRFNSAFISVNIVRVSPDLGHAKIYLSFLNEKDPESKLKDIRKGASSIRGALGSRIKNQIRKIPELDFYLDDTADYVEKMDQIFKEIEKKGNDEQAE